ncbi:MAG: four helix bundle protein [Parcubacteria group bacterium]|nr:four helix bundle protein [Parcubacteria group bacterium]
MEKFRNLIAWQKAHELVLELYKTTQDFPKEERFILIPQILRAGISVAANLAEGTKRKSVKDQRHFFNVAETSLEEVKYYIILSGDLKYISDAVRDRLLSLSQEVGRLIGGLTRQF